MFAPLLSLFLAAITLPPKPDHYVTDRAGVLPADRVEAIDAKLKAFEQSTSTQLIIYVDKKIPDGTTLEEMGAQAIREWGVGQKGKDNGAIVFIFTDDRKMRIEVGYGLEGSLTDARARLITSELMKPKIRAGDYAGAVDAAVNAIMNFTSGEEQKGGRSVAVAQANVAATTTNHSSPAIPLLFFFGFGAFVVFMATYGRKRGWVTASSSSDSSWSSSSSDSSSSSSDSGSDFSGGGGDGGGGGSSDSW